MAMREQHDTARVLLLLIAAFFNASFATLRLDF